MAKKAKAKTKTKASKGPREFYLDDANGNISIYEHGSMTYDGALKMAHEIIDDEYYQGLNEVTIYKRVAVVKPKFEKVEVVVKEIK